jgi:hypothetical protein
MSVRTSAARAVRYERLLRQSNLSEASALMRLLGGEGTPQADRRAAQIFVLARREGAAIDAATLHRMGAWVALQDRLGGVAGSGARGSNATASDALRGLRELAAAHAQSAPSPLAHAGSARWSTDERADMQALLRDFDVSPDIGTPEMENILLGEIEHTIRAERRSAESPKDLMYYFSEVDPQAFGPIAQRTIDAEESFRSLVEEASTNGGVLRQPQFDQIIRHRDLPVRTYLLYRALSSGLRTLEADWSSRAAGTPRTRSPIEYDDWVDALTETAAVYGNRPQAAGSTYMDRLLVSNPGDRLSSVIGGEDQLLTLLCKTRLLDVTKRIESRLSVMDRGGAVDAPFLQQTLNDLHLERTEMQRMAGARTRAAPEDLSPADAQDGLRIVLQLTAAVERFIRRH